MKGKALLGGILGAVFIFAAIGVAFFLPCIGAASQEALSAPSLEAHPKIGERLSFQGRWFGIPVGYGWIEVKGLVTIKGRRAYHIEAHGRTNKILSAFYPICDTIHTYIDAETLLPLRFDKDQKEGHYRADEIVDFDHASSVAHWRSRLNGSARDIEIPESFQDLLSAFYWLRRQPLESAQSLTVDIYTDEKIYKTKVQIAPPIDLEVLKRGTFNARRVEPKASFKGILVKRGRIWAYFTTGKEHLPILLKATTPWGEMSAVLDKEAIPVGLSKD